jgi:putative peptide zinc metalloprotease protein
MSERPPYKLRDDLIIMRRVFAGRVKYMVKDPLRLQYFSLAPLGYELLVLCDGKRDVNELLRVARKKFPRMQLTPEKLVNFYESFRKMHYIEDAWQRNVMLIEKRRRARSTQKALQPGQVNLFAFDPDWLLDRMVKPFGFLYTRQAVVAYGLIVLAALWIIFVHHREFELPFHALWTIPDTPLLGLVVLWACLLGTAMFHEFGHGLTCKRFGGEVHRIGMMLLYFSPCFFADVTESLFFERKAHKQAVTAAGGIVNLVLSSLATFVWFFTARDLWVNQLCHRVAIYSGFTTVMFNMNPLSRFDGYYLMSTHLDLPDLQQNSYRMLGQYIRRLLGLPIEERPWSSRERRIYTLYGVMSCFYLALAMTLIYLALSRWLVGAYRATGYVLAGLLFLKMSGRYRRGLFKFIRFFWLSRAEHFRRHRGPYLVAASALVVTLLLLPLPRHVSGAFTFRPGAEVAVRAEEAGVIGAVFVEQGDQVRAGSRLFAVAQDTIALDGSRGASLREEAEAQSAAASAAGDAAAAVSLNADAEAAVAVERWAAGREDRLVSSAPFDAVVLTPHLREKVGMRCAPGDTLCELGDLRTLRAEVQVDELMLGILEPKAPVELRMAAPPWRVARGRVIRIAPASSIGPAHSKDRRLYRVLVEVEDGRNGLRPGMTGQARFAATRAGAIEQLAGALARILRIEFWV